MQRQIIAATQNQGKIKEIAAILVDYKIISLSDLGFQGEIPETGNTFEQNALIKSRTVYRLFHSAYPEALILADDSGLDVDALDGRPGVFSARYAGENATSADRNKKLLQELISVPEGKRTARFHCCMALVFPDGSEKTAEGTCEGRIAFASSGSNGFGYDPVFLVKSKNFKISMADLSEEEKNTLSHRKKALDQIYQILQKEGLKK